MAVLLRQITWIDADGNERRTQILGNASTLAVQTQLLNMSQADELSSVEGTLTINGAPAAPGGQYRSVSDEADIWYSDAAGNIVQLTLPAPDSSIFLADTVTVDPANAAVTSLNTVVIGVVLTASGGTVTNYVGGRRSKRSGG